MLNRSHIPARLACLAVLLSAAASGEDRFLVKVTGDVAQIAQRNHLKIVKSFNGSGTGVHVLSAPYGSNAAGLTGGSGTAS